ncbi:MAG: transposase [Okeania sp. SIO2D1]|nr:transposase [Okeania sp. SIO2D1]
MLKHGTEILWQNVRKEIVKTEDGYLIFDDTVINQKYSQKIELVRRQYSGNEHKVVRGIRIVNCLYFNPQRERFWIIDYRIYNPESDEKSKIDNVTEMMIDVANKKKIPVKKV